MYTMKVVGVRELKDRLSEYLRLVQAGEDVLVTDRDEVVAELKRPSHGRYGANLPAGLVNLATKGMIRLGSRNAPSAYRKLARIVPHGTSKKLLDEDRGDR